ncbi:MAG: LysR substrate-binding domain-containing protein [Pseudomonadota bacterium]
MPPRPSVRQLQYFVAVAEYGGFGTAAEALAVSQPSLSKQLATMEAELDVTLFERTSRHLKLTVAGERLLPRARAVLRELRDLRAAAIGSSGLFGDRLAIGVLPSIGAYFMPPATRRLHRLFPQLRLLAREGPTVELIELLKTGRLDAVIGTPQNGSGIVSRFLFSETLWICAAADDPLSAREAPVTLDELAGRPLLSLSASFHMAEIVERLAEEAGAFVSRDYLGMSLDSLRQMALMGAGVAVLPSLYALAEAVRDPDFLVRRIEHPEAVHEINLIWRQSAPAQDDYLRLAEHLVEVKQTIRQARPEKFR